MSSINYVMHGSRKHEVLVYVEAHDLEWSRARAEFTAITVADRAVKTPTECFASGRWLREALRSRNGVVVTAECV